MNSKAPIVRSLSCAQTWRSRLQLLIALAILCGGSLARAQFQTETWLGTGAGTLTWTNKLDWTPQVVGTNGDALIFAVSPTNASANNFTNLRISSITFTTNGYALTGSALVISNGITDNASGNTNAGPNSESIALTLGASQTFQNNTTIIGTNTTYFTNIESGTIDLKTNTLTIGGSAPLFLNAAITSTNSGMLIVNNGSITRLAVSNSFGFNGAQITNYFQGAGTYTPAVTNYYTNSYVVVGVSTNYFVFSNVVALVTNGSTIYVTNVLGPQNPDVVWVQGGTLQLNNISGIPSALSGASIGNLKLDGTLDLNGISPLINGLEDSGGFSGIVDNLNPANTGLYTLTVGLGNSNGVFTGTIGTSDNINNPGASVGTIGLTKTGYGTETLVAANPYAGPTTINQGKLVIASGGSLGTFSQNVTILPGAVLDVSQLAPFYYQPVGPLTVAAGTPGKPYTNFLGSYDPTWGTNPTNYVVNTTTNNVLTYTTNYDPIAMTTNVDIMTNFASFSYSTNSIISIVTADVYGNFWVPGGGAISPITPISPGIATWAIQGNLKMDNALGLSPPLNKNRINFLLNDITTPGGGTNDLIAVSGNLTIGDELDFVITPLAGNLATGKYTLITSGNYTPETGGHAPNFQVILERGLQGDTVTVDPLNPNNIVFNSLGGAASPGSVIWAGTPALNNWDVDLTQNWTTNGPSGNPDYFYPQDNVTFDDIGNGTINLPVVVSPGSMTFNNNKTNITFTQSQSTFITGSGGLTMNGSGSVTLQNPNSFTGDITVNNGTLNLGYYSASVGIQYVTYNDVPAGNLIMGGGIINQLPLINVAPFAAFQNLVLMPGASTLAQSTRTASESPRYFITNQLVRAVGATLLLSPQTGNNCGIYFLNTNSPGGATYYGTNGILGGFATIFLNDWVNAVSSGNAGQVAIAYSGYQNENNPSLWGANSNVAVSASVSGIGNQTIYSLKINTSGAYALNINPGQTLAIASGGILIPTSTAPRLDAINGGTLMGATNADLILLNNNIIPGGNLTVSSVIADNGGPCGLTSAGGGTTILTGNNTYTGPTYINNGFQNVIAGTLQVGANGTSGDISHSSAVIDNGTLAFNRSDNITVNGAVSGTGGLKKLGGGALTLAANNSLSGLVTISAGTLQLGNGGAAGSVSNTVGLVDNATLVFDNNNTVSYPNPISGYGSFVQFGTGNLIIATNELYTGNTVISNGTLTVTASGSISNTAAIIVNGGATLDVSAVSGGLVLRSATPSEILAGSGTVNGSVTTASGATLSPGGDGVIGAMTINNNLTLSGGTFNFDVATTSSHDLINVGGTLAMNSGTVVISGTPAPGDYPLFHYTGGTTGATANLGLFVPAGVNAQLIVNAPNNSLDLLVSAINNAVALTWVGDGSANIWDVNNTPNWTAGAGAVDYANPDYATFDDTGSASTPVNITGPVSPSSVTNNANAKNYVLGANTGSAGKISGGAILVQNGASQLTLQTLNSYLGGTKINAGTVQLGNNSAAAEDGMVGSGGSVVIGASGALVVSNFAAETMSGSLSGSGQFVQQGVGKLTLTGNNSAFTGPISINTNGNGGKVFLQMGNGTAGTLSSGNVTNNSVLLMDAGPTPASTVTVAANISGSGNVTNIGPGIVLLTGSNTWAGNTAIPSGTIQAGSANALPSNAVVSMDDGNAPVGTLDLNGHNITIATLVGAATGSGNATYTPSFVVNNGSGTATLMINGGTTNTYNGCILDNNNGGSGQLALWVAGGSVAILNVGANNLNALSYPNLFSGGTIISNGTVALGTYGSGTATTISTACAGLGGFIMAGTNDVLATSGGNYPGTGTSTSPTWSTTLGTITATAGSTNTIYGTSRGLVTATLAGSGQVNYVTVYVRGQASLSDGGFNGTLIFSSINAFSSGANGGNLQLIFPNGFPNATIDMGISNYAGATLETLEFGITSGGLGVVPFGALAGGDSTVNFSGNGAATGYGTLVNTIYSVGGLNTSTTFGAQVTAGCGIRKVGTGTLTLTNNTLSYTLETVVSNGTLAFAPLGLVTNIVGSVTNIGPINYLTNTTYLVGTNITIVSPGILDLSQVGDNTLHLGHNGTQTLFGDGTIKGNLIATNNLIAPAWGADARGTFPGSLTITGNAEIDFGSTLQMAVSPTANDSLVVGGTQTLNSLRLAVITTGSAFANSSSNVFRFFSGPVIANPIGGTGTVGITNITVPAVANSYWVTNLTLDGSMALVNTNTSILNPNPPPVQVSVNGTTLTLGWPTNLGWILQSQTNNSIIGLSTNWVDVAGSATQTNAVITINPTNPTVFYRLRSPP